MRNMIVGLGEVLWDVFPDRKVMGGAPANFAYHVSQFGYNGYIVSAIGNDPLGKEILDCLAEKELNYMIEITDYPTGTVNVNLNNEGVPQYEICENVAWDNIPFTARTTELIANVSTVAFGSLAQRSSVSRETIKRFLKSMPESSLKIFDINIRQHFYTKELIRESLQLSNMLKINDEEVSLIARLFQYKESDEQDICKRLLRKYKLNIVILTKGTDGSFVFTPEEVSFLPTPKVEVVDTVGAGDSFTAAFVASYMQRQNLKTAHQLAVDVSAYVCTQHGAMPKLPRHLLLK